MNPTSFALDDDDAKLLVMAYEKTGVSRSEIVRRLIRFYAQGSSVPGLPTIDPPFAVRSR